MFATHHLGGAHRHAGLRLECGEQYGLLDIKVFGHGVAKKQKRGSRFVPLATGDYLFDSGKAIVAVPMVVHHEVPNAFHRPPL